jgi:hypothetical protein
MDGSAPLVHMSFIPEQKSKEEEEEDDDDDSRRGFHRHGSVHGRQAAGSHPPNQTSSSSSSSRVTRSETTPGWIRYSHVLRFSKRGAVKAVPESCSAYNPNGAMRGLLRPRGKAPSKASLSRVFPNPRRYRRRGVGLQEEVEEGEP